MEHTSVHAARFKPLVVVGIPAYNEEKTIGRVVLKSMEHAERVIVCDDGSTDLTSAIASGLGSEVVRHQRNLGYGAAIRTLFERACELGADVLVTLDGDGQHDPSEVAEVIKPIVDGVADVVIGSRFVKGYRTSAMPWYRRAGIRVITKLANNGAENDVRDAQSGFRAYNRKALESLVLLENGMGVSAEILIDARRQGLRVCEVSASCSYDNGTKTSTHNPVKQGVDVLASMVKLVVEEKPLKMLGLPGILFLIVGLGFGVWTLQIYGAEHRIITNIALAAITFVMIGFFALSTAITLYAISRLAGRLGKTR
jgi:glycosyltransferase involved in cell wall biosynthesis